MQTRDYKGWSGRRAKWREPFWTAFGLLLAAQLCMPAHCQAADEDVLAALQVTWRATFDGWLGGNHCNAGMGIVCDESGNIVEISITGYSMGGPLSTAIGSLTSLTKLLIENCCLRGPLPSTLGLLTNLESLSVKSNCLDGSVPDALGNLVSLQELRLGSNPFFGGTFPASFIRLSQLTTLDYSGSLFYCPSDGVYCTAKKPGYSASAFCRACLGFCVTCKTSASATLSTQEDALADLQYRWQLLIPGWYYGSNCIAGTGITCDGAGRVTSISLPCSYNSGTLRGSLATSIAILKSLTKLELISCTLTGSIPSNIGDLTNLQWINLSGNQLSGSIPSSIGNIISLQYLNLYDNIWMGGTLPASLIGLTRLTYLTFTPLMNCPPNGIACPGKKAGYSALPFCSQYCSSFCLTCIGLPPTPSPPPPKPSPPPPKASPPPPKQSPPPPKPSPPPPPKPSRPPPSPPSPPPPSPPSPPPPPSPPSPPPPSPPSPPPPSPPPPSPPPPKPSASPRPPPPKPKPPPPVIRKPPPPKPRLPPPKPKPPPPKPRSPPPKPKPPPPRPKPPPRRPPPPPPAPPPPLPARTYGFSAASTFAPRYLNRNVFRHASVGYDYARHNWILHSSTDWTTDNNRIGLAMPLSVKNQGACAACWAIAAVTAVDAAAALAYGTLADIGSVPDLSFQQVISCNGNYGCSGGLPSAALDYIADYARTGPNWPAQSRGLYLQSSIPYSATNASCKFTTCLTCKPTQYGITMFEQADFLTWFGLLLTLQQQPAVVSLFAACTSFLAYSSGIFEDTSCDGVPNHSVLAVGYRLDAGKPYWILQNSWGTKWGNAGRMQMAIVGGYGLCNLHLTPALYPVIIAQNPCDGDMNPCGDGACTPNGPGGNLCQCNDPFVAVSDIDSKTQSCVPRAVCSFYFYNPCSVGTCVDDGLGGYSCVCPPGFVNGVHATDDSSTCVPGMGLPASYQVSFGGLACDVLAATFGLTGEDLRAQNPELPDCSKPLPLGTVVNVTPPQSLDSCSVVYTWNEGDTCSDVADLFNMAESFADLERLNPWLQCTADPPALPGMQICVRRGQDPVSLANCTAYYTAQKGETCATIRDKFNLDVFSFYSLNPGIYCGRIQLSSDVLSGQQVCVSTSTSEYRQCPTGSTPRRVVPGDSCLNLAARFFGSLKRMADYNYGFQCSPLQLFAGRAICIPPTTTRQPPPISKQSARLLLSAREL